MSTRSYNFVQLDVFSRTTFTGNPLAVFTDARGLTDQEMQQIAREMNLSETTFIFPREPAVEAKEGTRVRIFTVTEELPFAGHPTLGTALYLYGVHSGSEPPREIVLDLNVGKTPVRFEPGANNRDRVDGAVFGEMRQRDPEFGPTISAGEVAKALRIDADIISREAPIQVVSTGLPFAVLPLRDLEALREVSFNVRDTDAVLNGTGAKFFYLVWAERGANEVHARMFFYGGEDPATGSAGGCCASWLVKYGFAESDQQITIRQGIEMGRPSEISVRATKDGDRVTNVRVGGYAIEVLRGVLQLVSRR